MVYWLYMGLLESERQISTYYVNEWLKSTLILFNPIVASQFNLEFLTDIFLLSLTHPFMWESFVL